ncbi:MAG TPA: lasso RiPP family leader peptide-containing protein [Gemmatimonadaceae bacterium]
MITQNVTAASAVIASGNPDMFVMEDAMYETPKLERYGTFRQLTQGGGSTQVDAYGPDSSGSGCVQNDGSYTCYSH